MKLILELTRAYPSTELKMFDIAYNRYSDVAHDDIVVLRREDQDAMPFGEQHTLPRIPTPALVLATVQHLLTHFLEDPALDRIDVYTYNGAVFDAVSGLTPELRTKVQVAPFSGLRARSYSMVRSIPAPQPQERQPQSEPGISAATAVAPALSVSAHISREFRWPTELIPIETALDALFRALAKKRAYSMNVGVRKTELRALLSVEDPLLDKTRAAVPGIMTALLRRAADKSVVEVEPGNLPNPRVWLADTPENVVRKAAFEAGRLARTRPSRSQHFLNVLREARLGPFSSIRSRLYDELERLVTESPITLTDLLKRCIDRTRSAEADPDGYPWRSVREFLINLLSRRPVLLDEAGASFCPSFSTLDRRVASLAPNWRLDLDGEMVIELAGKVDIALFDIDALAGALYFDRSDEYNAYITSVILRVLSEKRLVDSQKEHRLVVPISVSGDPVVSLSSASPSENGSTNPSGSQDSAGPA